MVRLFVCVTRGLAFNCVAYSKAFYFDFLSSEINSASSFTTHVPYMGQPAHLYSRLQSTTPLLQLPITHRNRFLKIFNNASPAAAHSLISFRIANSSSDDVPPTRSQVERYAAELQNSAGIGDYATTS